MRFVSSAISSVIRQQITFAGVAHSRLAANRDCFATYPGVSWALEISTSKLININYIDLTQDDQDTTIGTRVTQ